MVINLVGPPAVGKSTFAARYTLAHPEYTYLSIDQARDCFDTEAGAWFYLEERVLITNPTILESSGFSWRLRTLLANSEIKERKIFTICMYANESILEQRLKDRQKRQGNRIFHLDEKGFLRYTMENLDMLLTKADISLDISELSKQEVYLRMVDSIAKLRSNQ